MLEDGEKLKGRLAAGSRGPRHPVGMAGGQNARPEQRSHGSPPAAGVTPTPRPPRWGEPSACRNPESADSPRHMFHTHNTGHTTQARLLLKTTSAGGSAVNDSPLRQPSTGKEAIWAGTGRRTVPRAGTSTSVNVHRKQEGQVRSAPGMQPPISV